MFKLVLNLKKSQENCFYNSSQELIELIDSIKENINDLLAKDRNQEHEFLGEQTYNRLYDTLDMFNDYEIKYENAYSEFVAMVEKYEKELINESESEISDEF